MIKYKNYKGYGISWDDETSCYAIKNYFYELVGENPSLEECYKIADKCIEDEKQYILKDTVISDNYVLELYEVNGRAGWKWRGMKDQADICRSYISFRNGFSPSAQGTFEIWSFMNDYTLELKQCDKYFYGIEDEPFRARMSFLKGLDRILSKNGYFPQDPPSPADSVKEDTRIVWNLTRSQHQAITDLDRECRKSGPDKFDNDLWESSLKEILGDKLYLESVGKDITDIRVIIRNE